MSEKKRGVVTQLKRCGALPEEHLALLRREFLAELAHPRNLRRLETGKLDKEGLMRVCKEYGHDHDSKLDEALQQLPDDSEFSFAEFSEWAPEWMLLKPGSTAASLARFQNEEPRQRQQVPVTRRRSNSAGTSHRPRVMPDVPRQFLSNADIAIAHGLFSAAAGPEGNASIEKIIEALAEAKPNLVESQGHMEFVRRTLAKFDYDGTGNVARAEFIGVAGSLMQPEVPGLTRPASAFQIRRKNPSSSTSAPFGGESPFDDAPLRRPGSAIPVVVEEGDDVEQLREQIKTLQGLVALRDSEIKKLRGRIDADARDTAVGTLASEPDQLRRENRQLRGKIKQQEEIISDLFGEQEKMIRMMESWRAVVEEVTTTNKPATSMAITPKELVEQTNLS